MRHLLNQVPLILSHSDVFDTVARSWYTPSRIEESNIDLLPPPCKTKTVMIHDIKRLGFEIHRYEEMPWKIIDCNFLIVYRYIHIVVNVSLMNNSKGRWSSNPIIKQ